MKKNILVLLALLAAFSRAGAQEIQLNEDPRIGQMTEAWRRANRANPVVDGWRAQVMATTDRAQVEEAKTRFRTLFPDVAADWVHEKPYYKLRVGAFRSKLEALAFIAELSDFYPGSYPAKDANIHPRDFLRHE